MVLLIVFGLGIVFAVINYNAITGKKMFQIQKKLDIMYWAMAFSAFTAILFKTSIFTPVTILAFPVAFIFGILISESRNSMMTELVHFFFFSFILFAQLREFWNL